MLIDARTIPHDQTFEADLCIIGAGAAGITIAREFANKGQSVILLESGGFEFDEATQALNEGKTIGRFMPAKRHYVSSVQVRYFGGSTNRWEGWCRPLDAIDFEERSWVPNSGWPFPKSHLEPFYRVANDICQIKPFDYDPQKPLSPSRPPLTIGRNDGIVTKTYHLSPPTRFGEVYRKDVVDARNIRVLLHANVSDIVTNPNASFVQLLEVQCLTGNKLWVRAKAYVLAAGGIQNSRILLYSNKVLKAGLGNQHGVVGRYFFEHLNWVAGSAVVTKPNESMELYESATMEPKLGNATFGALSLAEDLQRRHQLLNTAFILFPKYDIRGMLAAIGEVSSLVDHFGGQTRPSRGPHYSMLYTRTEQVPNRDSRITLSGERDALGKPRVVLNWELSDRDTEEIRRSIEFLGRELGRNGFGRVALRVTDYNPWPVRAASHPMGGTRMHSVAKKGVVDANCRVHGVSNLYLAGSSVFPTGGFSNPTLTLVALALRLAGHLANVIESQDQ